MASNWLTYPIRITVARLQQMDLSLYGALVGSFMSSSYLQMWNRVLQDSMEGHSVILAREEPVLSKVLAVFLFNFQLELG
jgi:hypothetical protein